MRGFRQFCAGITVLLVAWSAQTVQAQFGPGQNQTPSSGGGLAWPPPQLSGQMPPGSIPPGMLPPRVAQAQYQQAPGGAPGVAPVSGAVNGMRPYPGLDLFRYGVQRTTYENGNWFKEMLNTRRDFHASVEYIVPIYGELGDTNFGYGGISTPLDETNNVPSFHFTTPRDLSTVNTDPDNRQNYFKVRSFDRMFKDLSGGGVRVNFGFTDEDGTGITVSGWHGGEANDTFQRGGVPTRSYIPDFLVVFPNVGSDPLFLTEVNALNGGLSINGGSGVADIIPFDLLYEMQISQQAWGAGVRFYRTPIASSSWYKVRPLFGMRYVDIREKFAFRGLDTGADYQIVTPEDVDTDTVFVEGNPDDTTFADGANDGTQSTVFPVVTFPTNPYETQIAASNQVRAAGPEIGVRADLGGGKDTKVWLMATAGITATREKLDLNGFGVYNHFINNVDPDNNLLTPDGGEEGTGRGQVLDSATAFSDQATTTHVSPLIDLSANLEIRLFEHIPVLNKIDFFEDAKFRTSYGFLYVGNISRPTESVNYTTFPINPSLAPNRSGWTMKQWTFGLDWEF